MIFERCWFDAERCQDGLQALRHYRYEMNDTLGTLERQPLHDWASHSADAFTYFAMAIRGEQRATVPLHPDEEIAFDSALNERDQGKPQRWNQVQ